MNERIRLLIQQASGFGHDDDGNELTPILVGTSLEKFAELIVRECAGIGYDASYYECALNVSNKIKKHFGVEE